MDIRIDMCVNMCIDMCMDVCIDMCMELCIDMCMDMCMDVCIGLDPHNSRVAAYHCLSSQNCARTWHSKAAHIRHCINGYSPCACFGCSIATAGGTSQDKHFI